MEAGLAVASAAASSSPGPAAASAAASSSGEARRLPLAVEARRLPLAVAAPARRSAGTQGAAHARPGERVLWSEPPFFISRMPRGVGASCCLHHDEGDDVRKVRCQKTLAFGSRETLTEAECVLRLKRWLLQGLDLEGPAVRTTHRLVDARRAGLAGVELDEALTAGLRQRRP